MDGFDSPASSVDELADLLPPAVNRNRFVALPGSPGETFLSRVPDIFISRDASFP
jgi:hypothetical protein